KERPCNRRFQEAAGAVCVLQTIGLRHVPASHPAVPGASDADHASGRKRHSGACNTRTGPATGESRLQAVRGSRSRRASRRGGRAMTARRHQHLWGYAFLFPYALAFLTFIVLPFVVSLVLAFSQYDLTSQQPIRFIGLHNFKEALFEDRF